jgi:hypothetical protein
MLYEFTMLRIYDRYETHDVTNFLDLFLLFFYFFLFLSHIGFRVYLLFGVLFISGFQVFFCLFSFRSASNNRHSFTTINFLCYKLLFYTFQGFF